MILSYLESGEMDTNYDMYVQITKFNILRNVIYSHLIVNKSQLV